MPTDSGYTLAYVGEVISLPEGREFTIGRSSSCDLVLDDAVVSRQHAVLRVAEGQLMLEDTSSTGVWVNGVRIAGSRHVQLGDEIAIGRQTLRVLGPRAGHSEHPTGRVRAVDGTPMELRKARILIVDDSRSVRELVRHTLSSEGYEVLTVESPFEASAVIEREHPDLVLVDVAMPGLPGDQIVRFVRTRDEIRNTRIVLYSARRIEELERLARECDADGYIQKTPKPEDLLGAVRAWAWCWR